ncbi:MAG TPA: NAD(P)/FAD-dependent oxidoreductase [Cyclobacteriaceae bacterium]|nr:NAD(P)/FAD-dependent oxidoreductase [Cyclobacteriaceae bacterium]
MSDRSQKKVTIIGAGLVGSLLAIYLAKRNYNVSVFERRADMRTSTADRGRSINLALSTRGLVALEEVGLANIIRHSAIPMKGRAMHDVKGNLSFLPYGKEGQFINSISRTHLNIILMDAAEKEGVTIKFDHRCTHIDINTNRIDFDNNTSHDFDLLIGADGAYSAVRGALQFGGRFNFSQEYIEHGYKELHIPASADGNYQLDTNALHIWPRESFMLIALPNPDRTFTGTLFFPFEGATSFNSLSSTGAAKKFFSEVFPDALKLIPDFEQQWASNPVSSLVTMKCWPWSHGNNVLLIGDAAHAVVPFYGQGMNAGFEDCRILNNLLDKHEEDWDRSINEFEALRKPDADSIATLALDNFTEMRDLVADEEFLLRKKIEAKLYQLYPDRWIPLYTMVTFRDDIRYSEAYAAGQKQKKIMDDVMKTPDIQRVWENLDFGRIIQLI